MLLAQLSDLHLRPVGLPAARVVETNMLAERAFRTLQRMHPPVDAIVLSGDLTEAGLAPEYEVLVSLLARHVTCPVLVIPGNHDQRQNFRALLAHLPGVVEDPEFVQYARDVGPFRLVMLDTVVPGQAYGELCARRLAWFERTLDEGSHKPTIVVMHHPPFDCGIAHMDRIKLREPEAFIAIVRRHPEIKRILCGHVHRPTTTRIAQAIATIAPSIAHQVALDLDPSGPAAFVMEPAAFQLHHVAANAAIVSHIAYVEEFPGPFPFLPAIDPSGH
ncbi:MAG: phosphodiesterase [Acetobacteraceae bacterium]